MFVIDKINLQCILLTNCTQSAFHGRKKYLQNENVRLIDEFELRSPRHQPPMKSDSRFRFTRSTSFPGNPNVPAPIISLRDEGLLFLTIPFRMTMRKNANNVDAFKYAKDLEELQASIRLVNTIFAEAYVVGDKEMWWVQTERALLNNFWLCVIT